MINLEEQLDLSLLNLFLCSLQTSNYIVNEMSPTSLIQHLLEQCSWLLKVVIWMNVLESACLAFEIKFCLLLCWIFHWSSKCVWFIVRSITLITIHSHESISLIVIDFSCIRTVNRNLIKVRTQSMSVSIWI